MANEAERAAMLLAAAQRSMPHSYACASSQGRWKPYRWLTYVSNIIAPIIQKGNGRIIITAPPRFGKSEFISHWCSTWYIDTHPGKKIILASHGQRLSSDFSRAARQDIDDNPYSQTRLRPDSQSVGLWHTSAGGQMLVSGIGGGIGGFGYHLGIIDDIYNDWAEAYGAYNETAWNWWRTTFRPRAEPNATIIIASARWAEEDLIGRILAESGDEWTHIRLPAMAEKNDPLGRAEGESLCPERYDVPALMSLRKDAGQAGWDALFQQAPQAFGTGRLYGNASDLNIDTSVSPRTDLPLALTLDFNRDPGMHGELGWYDNRSDLFGFHDELHGPRMSVTQMCEAFRVWLEGKGWRPGGTFPWKELHIFGDATEDRQMANTTETSYQTIVKHLRTWGIPHRLRYPRSNPPVRDRLDTVNEALKDVEGRRHIVIHPRCLRLLADLKSLKADQQGLEDKRVHALSHASSALGYFVFYMRPLLRGTGSKVGGRIGV